VLGKLDFAWISTHKIMKLYPYLTPCTKINLKYTKDLTITSEAIKLLEENIRESFSTFILIMILLDLTPKS
jgi:hypothetical protein